MRRARGGCDRSIPKPLTYDCSMLSLITLYLVSLLQSPPIGLEGRVERVAVFEQVQLKFDADLIDGVSRDGYVLRNDGRIAERTVDLPPLPEDHRDTRRITATVEVTPSLVEVEGGYRPGDPWPRIGAVSVLVPDGAGNMMDVELMRFITGYGGSATFTDDLTALAPLLYGPTTIRILVNTYMNPAWDVSLQLVYTEEEAGFRRPELVKSLFMETQVNAENNMLRQSVTIPEGLHRPRLRILTTGHATDGRGGDEFVTRTHILRINGEEISRWKPWAEHGHSLRHLNPASGRVEIDGREIWASDFDRSGWNPGLVVKPLMIPVPELTPGEHEIELEVLDIRPPDRDDDTQAHGYWRVSVIVVADEPWPHRGGVRRGARDNE